MLATLFHVVLFVAAIIGLLAIKQKRLRHIPNRRTHISRRSAEGTIWLQRAVNGVLDMLHCALAEQQEKSSVGVDGSTVHGRHIPASTSSAKNTTEATTPSHRERDADNESGTEVPSDLPFLNTLKVQLEEQISALLEDKGIASFADFRIKDWGGKPPMVKAICLTHGGGAGAPINSNNSNPGSVNSNAAAGQGNVNGNAENLLAGQRVVSGGLSGVPSGPVGTSAAGSPNSMGPQHYASFGGSVPLSASTLGWSGPQHGPASSFSGANSLHSHLSPNPQIGERGVSEAAPSIDAVSPPYSAMNLRHRTTNNNHSGSGEEMNGGGGGGGNNGRERSMPASATNHSRASVADASNGSGVPVGGGPATSASFSGVKIASDTTRSLSVLEAEVEVEYSGQLSVSLNADIPIARGRYLQTYASISDVRMLAAHVRLRLALEHEPATVESPQPQPYLQGTLWLMSDPVFDVAFHSSLTQYRIRDFFLIPKLIKFFLLRFLRSRLRPSSSSSSSSTARHSNARRRRPGGAGLVSGSSGVGGVQGSSGGPGASDEVPSESERSGVDGSGLSFRVQLPADIVDGGEQWWSAMARDTMSECPAPFLSAYHQR